MRVRWGCMVLVILAVLALAYNRDIAGALRQVPLSEMWQSFTDELRAMPRMGRFVAVTAVLALAFTTLYKLALAFINSRNGPRRDG